MNCRGMRQTKRRGMAGRRKNSMDAFVAKIPETLEVAGRQAVKQGHDEHLVYEKVLPCWLPPSIE